MVGTTGFLALWLLAASPVDATHKTNHLQWGKTQTVSQTSAPFQEEKAEGTTEKKAVEKTEENATENPELDSNQPERLPKALPIDPGYDGDLKTPEQKKKNPANLKWSPGETDSQAEKNQTTQEEPVRQEEELPAVAVHVDTDPCGEESLPCRQSGMRGWLGGISTEGWLDQGATLNTLSPQNRTNEPVTFNNRSNDYQLNQFYLRMKRDVDLESCDWDLGGRVDMLYGTDSYYLSARGLEVDDDLSPKWNAQQYGLAMPQMYMEVFAPWGNGINFKLGHFYSILGYESAPATGNFFYSHSYVYQYGEPQTFTGVLGESRLGDFTIQAGMTRGWNNWEDDNNDLDFVGGIHWISENERTKVSFCVAAGREQPEVSSNIRTSYSLVIQEKIGNCWEYVVQHDLGSEPGAGINGSVASWYGIDNYLFYTINERWKAGMRFEWFCDLNGSRVPDQHQTTNYFELTGGVNWTPNNRIMVRPELRWDWCGTPEVYPFGDGTRSNQLLLACDVILKF